jgi:hypothetical protein
MASFNYTMDSSRVVWGQTIIMNLVRMLVGGAVLALIVFANTRNPDALFLLAAPLYWLVFGLPAWYILQRIRSAFGVIGGPIAFAATIFVLPFVVVGLVGDPLVFAISKLQPNLLPVEKPRFLSFSAALMVLRP